MICLLAFTAPFTLPAKGLTVSGRVAESDAAPVAGVTITVVQVGGELPAFTTQTGADGTWSVSDPLLTGNIQVTPSSPSFQFTPATRESFTSSTSLIDWAADPNSIAGTGSPLVVPVPALNRGANLFVRVRVTP